MESVDWRTQHPSDLRQKVVNKIMDTLKKHIPVSGQERLNEIKDIALRFEDKTYTTATSQTDYMRRISMKLLSMENRSANPIPNSLQSNSARNTVNPSDSGPQAIPQVNSQGQPPSMPLPCNHPQAGNKIMPPVSGISQSTTSNMTGQSPNLQNTQSISFGNNVGHGIPSVNSVNQNQRQIPGTQRYVYQQQHPNVLHPSQFQPSQQSVPQHTVLQPSQFQLSQQSVPLPTMVQASSLSTLKQNQQTSVPQLVQPVSRQSVLSQQRPQPNTTNMQHIHYTGQPCNVQQQHQHVNFSSIHQQYSGHMLQSMQGQRSQMPQLQTQSAQRQNQLNVKQRLPTSAAFQSPNVIDPQNQIFQQQRAMPEASSTSSDSTAQIGNPNGGDWQEEVYQKMKAMNDKYMPYLKNMYQKLLANFPKLDSLPQQQKNEQVVRMKRAKQTLEHYMSFLQVPKNKIPPKFKENLDLYEIQIVNFLTDKRKPGTTINNAPRQSQQTQANENQLNSQHNNNIVNLNHNSVSNTNQNIIGTLQPNSNVISQQQVKQIQNIQVHQQLPQKQKLLNERQFHQQTKHQQQNGQQIKVKSESESESSQQRIKAPFSPQVDHQNMLNSATKCGRPLQFGNSPSIVSSPSTPSTSHIPGDAEKVNSGVSSLSNGAMLPTEPPAIGTPSISTSPLLVSGNQVKGASLVSGNSSSIEDPMEHLLNVVKSISQKSLSESVSNIGSVVSMIDSIAGPTPGNGSRAVVGEDLAAMTKSCLQERTFVTHDGTRRMKRLRSQMPLNVGGFMHLNWAEASELESTATSTIKRRRIETRNPLLDEIRAINQGLIDTVVNISEEEASSFSASEIGKGTVVKCSFSPVAVDPNLKSLYTSKQMSSIQPLRLLVPTNYPTCSPVLLDTLPLEVRDYEDLSNKAKLRFSCCVRQLSNPMSLEEMARTWDVCARAVIIEYSQQTGGGTFSTKNGAWKDFLTAS